MVAFNRDLFPLRSEHSWPFLVFCWRLYLKRKFGLDIIWERAMEKHPGKEEGYSISSKWFVLLLLDLSGAEFTASV